MDPVGTSRGVAPFPPPAGVAGVVLLDSRGAVLGWTAGAQSLVGYRAQDVVRRSAARLVHGLSAGTGQSAPADGLSRASVRRRMQAIARDGAWSGTVTVRHRAGHTVALRAQVAATASRDGVGQWLVLLAPAEDPLATGRITRQQVLTDHSPVALAVWDTDLRCVWANRIAGHDNSPFRRRRRGLPMRQALRGFDVDTIEAVMRQVLEDGSPVVDHEFRWVSEEDGQERLTSSTLFRLQGDDGVPWGLCTVSVDITASRARAQLALVSEAGRRVGTTLDVATTAQELANVAVPLFADFVTVDLVESVPLGGDPLGRATGGGPPAVFRRAATASVLSGAPESVFAVGDPVFLPPASPLIHVLETGDPYFAPSLKTRSDAWLGADPRRAASMRRFAMHSTIVVPLAARDTLLGVSTFVRTTNPAPFTSYDLLLAQEIARRAALSLDNARRYTREREATLALQRNMLPRRISGAGVMDVASRYVPAGGSGSFGGDWFDVVPLPGGRLGLMVGDVVGRGIDAVATMGRLRTAARTLALLDLPPHELLARFDQAALTLGDESQGPDGFPEPLVGATCVYVDYDPVTSVGVFASAGHLPPALVPPGGRARYLDLPQASFIGLGEGGFASREVSLPPGTVVALFTDGLIAAPTTDIGVGLERLRALLPPSAHGLEDQCSQIIDTMAGQAPADDVALLLARVPPGEH